RRHAEMAGDVLEPVGRQVSRGHVVELGENPRVDDVAPRHGIPAVGDAPVGDLHARGMTAERGAAASPRQRNLVTPGARLDVLEVEAEDIVPLDGVGIALADEPRALASSSASDISAPDKTVVKPAE